MQNAIEIRGRRPSEDGYMLLAVIFLLFLLAISLTIAAPIVARSLQRDREVETMHRGKQYERAIQLYYRKFPGTYPPSIDALVKTNNIRFLRKRYIDPMTGKDDWKPILFGQNKAPLAMGFFGEPLAAGATALAGTGPSGGNTAGTGLSGQSGSALGSSSGLSSGSGSIFGSGTSSGAGGSLFGSSDSGQQNPTAGTGSGTGGNSGASGGSTGASGQSGSSVSGSGSTSGSGFMSGQTGQTFGGAGIVGFSPASTRQSILLYKQKNHYNEWEFTYSPLSDQKQITGGNTGSSGLPSSGTSGTGSGFFGGSSATGSASSTGTSSGGTSGAGTGSGTSPTQPQQ